MTAGKGVVHSEMFPLVDRDRPNPLHLFQIWLNLPAVDKMVDAHFTMFWGDDLPRRVIGSPGRSATITVLAGGDAVEAELKPPPNSWAARPESDIAIWELALEPGAAVTIDPTRPDTNRALYLFDGDAVDIAGTTVPSDHRVVVDPAQPVTIQAGAGHANLLMLQGRPIGEPVAQYGPFVMNSHAEVQEAFADYRTTQFGGWPWPSDDPTHPSGTDRFARHADGREERPPTAS